MIQLLSYLATAIEEQVAKRGRHIFGAKSKGWRHKMFQVFTLYNLIWLLESKNPVSGTFNAVLSEKRCLTLINMHLTSGEQSFPPAPLQNPDW